MNKKKFLVCLAGVLFLVGIAAPLSAESSNLEENTDKTEEVATENQEETPTFNEENTNDVETSENDDVVDGEEITQSPTQNQTKKVTTYAAGTITNREELEAALASATNGSIIVIEGGSVIELTNSLKINTANITDITFASSNGTEVIITNASGKRHIEVSGANALKIKFEKIVFSGPTETTIGGGINITNNAVGNQIDGIIARNNKAITNSWETGFIQYKGTGGSFTLSNATFTGNGITSRNAVGSTVVYLDAINAEINMNNIVFDATSTLNQNGSVIGIYNDNGNASLSNITVKNSTATSISAGLKYTGYKASTLLIDASDFNNNSNTEGTGGAFDFSLRNQSSVTLQNSNVSNNFGHRGGAGINARLENTGVFKIDNVNFSENKSSMIEYDEETGISTGLPSSGGAVNLQQLSGKSQLLINNSKFINNEAGTAGAMNIYNGYGAETKTVIKGSIFDGNTADYHAGAIDFNYTNDADSDELYSIKDTQIINNTVTGKDRGPGYYRGGYGGGIYFGDLASYPEVLKLDTVTFGNNKSQYPVVWNYSATETGTMNEMYKNNVSNTTYSSSSYNFIEGYNNAYNGDDVYLENTGSAHFAANPDNLEGLEVENYPNADYAYNSVRNAQIIEPKAPVAAGYTFLGWYDENDVKWDFDTMNQTVKTQNLHAKWEKNNPILTEGTVVVYYQDENGKSIATQAELKGTVGTTFTIDTPAIEGYTYFKTESLKLTRNTESYVFTSEAQTFNVIYKKNGSEGTTETSKGSKNTNPDIQKPSSPVTADTTQIGLLVITALLALGIIAIVGNKKKQVK